MIRLARAERGSSLVEVMTAVAVIGAAFTGLLLALSTGARSSAAQRDDAAAAAHLVSYAELAKVAPYVACGSPADYTPTAVGLPTSSGLEATVTEVSFWEANAGDPATGSFVASCPGGADPGLQRLKLRVTSSDGETVLTREIVKRAP